MNIKIAMALALLGIMTLCLVITKPLANQAFAKIPCESLTLKANPGSVAHTPDQGTAQHLTGQLICGVKGPADAKIQFVIVPSGGNVSPRPWSWSVKTDYSGKFEWAHSAHGPGIYLIVFSPTSYIITAKYVGDGTHEAANPATIKITTTP